MLWVIPVGLVAAILIRSNATPREPTYIDPKRLVAYPDLPRGLAYFFVEEQRAKRVKVDDWSIPAQKRYQARLKELAALRVSVARDPAYSPSEREQIDGSLSAEESELRRGIASVGGNSAQPEPTQSGAYQFLDDQKGKARDLARDAVALVQDGRESAAKGLYQSRLRELATLRRSVARDAKYSASEKSNIDSALAAEEVSVRSVLSEYENLFGK